MTEYMYQRLTPETAMSRLGQEQLFEAIPAVPETFLGMREHQVLLSRAMAVMEGRRLMQLLPQLGTHFRHDIGVLTTEAGAGKTLVCLLLSMARPEVQPDEKLRFVGERITHTRILGGHATPLSLHRLCFHTLLLVPSDLGGQWEGVTADQARIPRGDFLVFRNLSKPEMQDRLRAAAYATRDDGPPPPQQQQQEGRPPAAEERPKIILMTSTAYAQFMKTPLFSECVFQRVIIDEAHSIRIGSFRFVAAHFTWLVTASAQLLYDNITSTHGLKLSSYGDARKKQKLDAAVSGLPLLPQQQQQFPGASYEVNMDAQWWQAVTVSCDAGFVAQNVVVPHPVRRTLYYRRRRLHAALHTSMPEQAMQALAAGDVRGAVAHMRCRTVNSEDGLVAAVTGRLRESEEQDLRELGGLDASSADDRAEIAELTRRLERTRRSMEVIAQRVRESDVCPITMEPVATPAVTPCCNNRFELSALAKAMSRSQMCPMCREPMSETDIIVVHEGGGGSGGGDTADRRPEEPDGSEQRPYQNVLNALEVTVDRVFRERPDARVLVFSEHDMERVEDVVVRALAPHGATAALLTGNHARVGKVMRAFRNGTDKVITRLSRTPLPVRVLLLDAKHFGAGHNIEFATHVVTLHAMCPHMDHQIVGRAQRWGRTEPLRILDVRMARRES